MVTPEPSLDLGTGMLNRRDRADILMLAIAFTVMLVLGLGLMYFLMITPVR
ncbi:MAG: hypothetical protein JNJ51_04340 [Methylobacillus glycogenes]|nr:hypothetical protein [Methylobacillus glycogenes]